MLSLISSSSLDTSAMQSEAYPAVLLDSSRYLFDPHKQRNEMVYAICVFAAGVLLLITAI